jgi:hypothetical protein
MMDHRSSSDSLCDACTSERRANRRLAVRLGVAVRVVPAGGGSAAVERTVTRNISPGDMSFESGMARQLHAGQHLDVDIELPMEGATIFADRRLQARGKVVRVDPPGPDGSPGVVAVVFENVPAFHPAPA